MFGNREPSEMSQKEILSEVACILAGGYRKHLKSLKNKDTVSENSLDSLTKQSVHDTNQYTERRQ